MRAVLALFVLVGLASPAAARVDRIEITARADVLGGRPFGANGAYEKITARVHFKVRPDDPANRAIVDLGAAARGGEVEFSADLFLLRPKDPAKGNGALFLEVPNRGRKGLLTIVNGAVSAADPTAENEFGDGWFMRHGYTYAVLGWQWDVHDDPGLLRLYAPVARGKLTGLLRDDFTPSEKVHDVPLGHQIGGNIGGTEYPAAAPDDPRNQLTVRDRPGDPRRPIPRGQWRFAHRVDGKLAPSRRHLHLASGFEPGRIYELIY